eukprot:3426504-Rhodomonas_salina.4
MRVEDSYGPMSLPSPPIAPQSPNLDHPPGRRIAYVRTGHCVGDAYKDTYVSTGHNWTNA